jgi:pyruvate,water dikinase
MPVAVATCLRRVRASRAAAEGWWRSARNASLSEPDAQRVLREARPLFVQNMLLHTVISMLASGVYEKVDLLARSAGDGHSAPQLVTGYGTVEETRVAADLWALSRDELDLATVLDRHGWHGINNGQLHVAVWREEPEHVRALADRIRELPVEHSPVRLGKRQQVAREQAESALMASLSRTRRLQARPILTLAQKFVSHREVGKAGYLIAVDGARLAARTLGEIWAKAGHLAEADDVFFLTLDEVQAGPQPTWPDLIGERRELDRTYRQQSLPMAWVGVPEPIRIGGDTPYPNTGTEFSGLGVSPGIVEGVARVVTDPHEDDLRPGEILVCATTDPSWVSLFLAASAVVIDIGGQLSHGAIVARELGIPCVVNTRDGSRRIRTGDALRIDGSTGQVSILTAVPQETP